MKTSNGNAKMVEFDLFYSREFAETIGYIYDTLKENDRQNIKKICKLITWFCRNRMQNLGTNSPLTQVTKLKENEIFSICNHLKSIIRHLCLSVRLWSSITNSGKICFKENTFSFAEFVKVFHHRLESFKHSGINFQKTVKQILFLLH